jgi:P-type E1-E2 ATPase
LGLQATVLTGDRVERAVAAGFENAYGQLSPLDKASLVQRWEAAGQRCLFVGDGINDAAALSRASASIALASGAELAGANAQATLLSGELTVVPWAVQLSRQALGVIRTNLIWAASYNALGVAAAAAGSLHPVAAALLMVGSSLLVTGRSIRFANAQLAGEDGPALARHAAAPVSLDSEPQWQGACCSSTSTKTS